MEKIPLYFFLILFSLQTLSWAEDTNKYITKKKEGKYIIKKEDPYITKKKEGKYIIKKEDPYITKKKEGKYITKKESKKRNTKILLLIPLFLLL